MSSRPEGIRLAELVVTPSLSTVLFAYAALEGQPGGGYLQRAAIVPVSIGLATLYRWRPASPRAATP